MLATLAHLKSMGNTLIVVEHDEDTIRSADQVIEIGPEGGHKGGQLLASGTPEQVAKNKRSHTGRFLKRYLG